MLYVTTAVCSPAFLIDGKMATESCDAVNMDPDMELLSDEELERWWKLQLCCQRMKNAYIKVFYWYVCSNASVVLIFLSQHESLPARYR